MNVALFYFVVSTQFRHFFTDMINVYCLLFLSLLIPISPISNKQTNKEDFSQYSYQISIEIRGEKKTANGTGFFLFYDSSFYFITAEHCLTGCKQNTRPILSDTVSIFGIDSNGAIYTIVSVDISNVKKELLSCPPHWDIIALKISGKILDKTKIHSVEKFIKPPCETTSDAMFIGFPGYVNKTSRLYLRHQQRCSSIAAILSVSKIHQDCIIQLITTSRLTRILLTVIPDLLFF